MQQNRFASGLEFLPEQFKLAVSGFTRQKFFQQQGLLTDGHGGLTQTHDQCFIAQCQEAGRLQPDDGNAFFSKGQQGIDHLLYLSPGGVDHATGKIGPATAQRFAICYGFSSYMGSVSGGCKHF